MVEFDFSGWFDKALSVLFVIAFGMTAIVILTIIIKGLIHLYKESKYPKLTVIAAVVGKRADVSCDHSWTKANGRDGRYHTYSTYFVTFEEADGERVELELPGTVYGLLAEGDRGALTFKGTRYLGFERPMQEKGTVVLLEETEEEGAKKGGKGGNS